MSASAGNDIGGCKIYSAAMGLTYYRISFAQAQWVGEMLQAFDVGFAAGVERQVGDLETLVLPVLDGERGELGVFGCEYQARIWLAHCVPAEFH